MQHCEPPEVEIFGLLLLLGESSVPMRVSSVGCISRTVCGKKGLTGVLGATAYRPLCRAVSALHPAAMSSQFPRSHSNSSSVKVLQATKGSAGCFSNAVGQIINEWARDPWHK